MFKPLAVLTQGRYDYVNVEELGVAVAQRDAVSRVLASPVGLGADRLRQCAGALPLHSYHACFAKPMARGSSIVALSADYSISTINHSDRIKNFRNY